MSSRIQMCKYPLFFCYSWEINGSRGLAEDKHPENGVSMKVQIMCNSKFLVYAKLKPFIALNN